MTILAASVTSTCVIIYENSQHIMSKYSVTPLSCLALDTIIFSCNDTFASINFN